MTEQHETENFQSVAFETTIIITFCMKFKK